MVLGQGHVSDIAASITTTQIDHLKDMQISENEDTNLTTRVHAAITQSNEHAERTQLNMRARRELD